MKFLSIIFTLSLALLFLGCPKEKPPDVIIPPTPTNCEYPAGNRNFTWRLDTIAWWPSFMGGVHAFSDSDAWVMGSMVSPTGQSYVGWHWDGKKWNEKVGFLSLLMKANDVTGDEHFMVGAGYLMFTGVRPAIAEFDNKTKKWQRYDFAQTAGELRSVWTDGKGYFIAVGDNGMVYTKDGYEAEWVYSKAPTEFNLYRLTGISKDEIYTTGYLNLATGENYRQCWKIEKNNWIKFYDTQDTTNTILSITSKDYPGGIGAFRCNISDSLKFYVIGNDSYLFGSKGQSSEFTKINLQDLGLPLKINGRTGVNIDLFSPNDYWVIGTRFNFYHWNGSNFQKIVIPGLPNDDAHFGDQRKMIKTKSGRIFLPTEVSSQVYVVVQGTAK